MNINDITASQLFGSPVLEFEILLRRLTYQRWRDDFPLRFGGRAGVSTAPSGKQIRYVILPRVL